MATRALTAAQRRRLPDSAFAYVPARGPKSARRYPMPTKAQAQSVGLSEGARRRIINNAKARSAQARTRGTPGKIQPVARRRRGAAPAPRRGQPAAPYRRYRGSTGRLTRGASGWKTKRATTRRRTSARRR